MSRLAGEILARENPHDLTVVFPNKRPVYFLRKYLTELHGKPLLMPEMLSVNDFFRQQTGTLDVAPYEQLFVLYEAYMEMARKHGFEPHSFSRFLGWAPVLLQDFEEIDQYLTDASGVFKTVYEHKEINIWAESLGSETNLAEDYLNFFRYLHDVYELYHSKLLEKSLADKGMLYRLAWEQKENWSQKFSENQILIAGFYAMTRAEEEIFSYLVRQKKAEMFWDVDRFYMERPFDVSRFTARNRKIFNTDFINWTFDCFQAREKTFTVVEAPDNLSQIQYVSNELSTRAEEWTEDDLMRTAVVLPEPELFYPFLFSLPDNIPSVNITFGLPVENLKVTRLIRHYVKLLDAFAHNALIDKNDLLSFLKHPFVKPWLHRNLKTRPEDVLGLKKVRNVYVRYIKHILQREKIWNWFEPPATARGFFKKISDFVLQMAPYAEEEIEKAGLVEISGMLEKIAGEKWLEHWNENRREWEKIFHYLLGALQIGFEGEPLKGLQVMGLLETRLLDFDRLFILSMNEGVIPRGKTEDSFIPYEIRKFHGLPVDEDKNAMTSYHVYRLWSHTRENHLLYVSNLSDMVKGEKSRYIKQLEHTLYDKGIQVEEIKIQNRLPVSSSIEQYQNDEVSIRILKEKFSKGISPSFLTSYLYYPDQFYKNYVIGIREEDISEDIINDRLMGEVIHQTMEDLYKPYVGKFLNLDALKEIERNYEQQARKNFYKIYLEIEDKDKKVHVPVTGENLLAMSAIQEILKKFIAVDKKILEKGQTLKIVALEESLHYKKSHPDLGLLRFYGKADRIDEVDGQLRIVDYKTGKADMEKPPVFTLETFKKDSKYKIGFQMLFYAWILSKQKDYKEKFSVQTIYSPRVKNISVTFDEEITQDNLNAFEEMMMELLQEIIHPETVFEVKESYYKP